MTESSIHIRLATADDQASWNSYAGTHPDATCYHLFPWKMAVEEAYEHKTYYLLAEKKAIQEQDAARKKSNIAGIFPLIHIKHLLFGNGLISLPFCDYGGILADDRDVEKALIQRAIETAREINTTLIEIRQVNEIVQDFHHEIKDAEYYGKTDGFYLSKEREDKVRMSLVLPDSSEKLMKSFKSKLRSQIQKPIKEGLTGKIGGLELLDDFYEVFAVNMRDLGSPVHSKYFLKHVISYFDNWAKVGVVYHGKIPIAAGLVISFRETLFIPWASSLRLYNSLNANMLLYWNFLEHACKAGMSIFDFGRSSHDAGTYKFKEQWGARPSPIHWMTWSTKKTADSGMDVSSLKNQMAINAWKRMPVNISTVIGPKLRKYIWL